MADPKMIDAYLQRRGAAPSIANANRVREHFAANPDQLDRAAMGLPPGLEDRVPPTLDMMLDKVIADTSIEQQPLADISPQTEGDRNPAPAPSRRGPTTNTQGASRQGEYGPGPSPSRQGGYGAATRPAVSGMVNEQGMPVEYTGEANVTPPEDSGILKWLLPILGLSAAVPAAENMRGQMPMRGPQSLPTDPNSPLLQGPQSRITSQVGPNMESVGQEMETITNRNAASRAGRERILQTEIDAENDAMMRQMLEQERARKAQKRTQELVGAAKRATGRR